MSKPKEKKLTDTLIEMPWKKTKPYSWEKIWVGLLGECFLQAIVVEKDKEAVCKGCCNADICEDHSDFLFDVATPFEIHTGETESTSRVGKTRSLAMREATMVGRERLKQVGLL